MKIIEVENLTFSKKENNNTFDDVKAIIIPKEVYQKQIDDYTVKIWELEDRIYKAIEYIEKNCILSDTWKDLGFCDFVPIGKIKYKALSSKKVKELLDILKGVDKE